MSQDQIAIDFYDREDSLTTVLSELVCGFGLLPFIAWFISSGSVVAFIVFFNGILFHIFFPNSFFMKTFDICCNAVLVILINIFAWNLIVVYLTCFSVVCFVINSMSGVKSVSKSLVHVIGVQGPLFLALIIAEAKNPYVVLKYKPME
jgi:hypothetical protein